MNTFWTGDDPHDDDVVLRRDWKQFTLMCVLSDHVVAVDIFHIFSYDLVRAKALTGHISFFARTKMFMSDATWYQEPIVYLPARVIRKLAFSGAVPGGQWSVKYHRFVRLRPWLFVS